MSDGRERLSGSSFLEGRSGGPKTTECEAQASNPDGEQGNEDILLHDSSGDQLKKSISKPTVNSLSPTESNPPSLNSDPASWPRIVGAAERNFLVTLGPPKPLYDYRFPCDVTGRKFSSEYYTRRLRNGEQVPRDWLVYSISKNCMYSFCYKLFGYMSSSLSKELFMSWKHIAETLTEHETSKHQIQAQKSWLEFSQRLKISQTIDPAA
ncbi:zinc finger MYM-type protein 5-like [Schistocerca gregaria]|uniref:zinc finger MYM-type protein 5-like n=1 Tax=Schistocerca gregaria TaxID=7010 RepID=UPI00211EEF13|nr:zinc finger MYM-type protein 5-like [Schistocerca gregaria]